MINLLIKGDVKSAIKSAKCRGLILKNVKVVKSSNDAARPAESIGQVAREDQLRVAMWFCEENTVIDGFGYPIGTLLHYSFDDDEPNIQQGVAL
ncbi:MAG: hypothetical protein ACREBG_09080 [Pyrinomonadaceae bacterium]